MSRSRQIILFVLCATLVNVAATALIFLLLLWLYALTLSRLLPAESISWAVMACFLIAMVTTAFLYKLLLQGIRARWNLDDILGAPQKR